MTHWDAAEPGTSRIKICGVKTRAHVAAAIEAGADAVGLVLAAGSPRQIDLDTAHELADACADAITPVCLLVNPTPEALANLPTQWVQLHGQEDVSVIAKAAASYQVIKAVPAADEDAVWRADADPNVHRLLVDAPVGGSGAVFDHQRFEALARSLRTPFLIAGGLDPTNVARAVQQLAPWGVDVSSGVEATRGEKCPERIAAFCAALRT